ncbi:MAG: ABC transporter permease [Candidatus Bathyarchaeota archaeon]|nr:ABC transporter permease [Candidatus Bathyarchaeota archaeon]
MRAITVFKAVTKNWLRSRAGLFFSIMFPILLLVVFGAIFSGVGGSSRYGLFVQNQDVTAEGSPTELSSAFVTALNSTGTFSLTEVPVGENATDYARQQLGPLGGSMRILIISEGFQDDLINGTMKVRVGICFDTLNMSYQYFEPYMNDTQKSMLEDGLTQMQQLNSSLPDAYASLTIMLDSADQSAGVVQSIVASVANAFNYELIGAGNVITFTQTSVSNTQFRTIDFYIPGITAAFIMTNGIIGLTSTNTEFKRRGIIKRLSLTPLTKMDWVVGCILSQTLLNIILSFIMIGVGWIVFNVRVIPDALTILLIFLGSVMFSGIGMIFSGVIKDIEAANAIGNAVAFPMMFLSGTYFPLEIMPSYLQSVSKVLPLTYFSEGLKATMITKFADGIVFNMAVVAVLAVVFILIGVKVTRWREK